MQVDLWTYREADALQEVDVTGFEVEATDGEVGTVVEAAYELGSSWLVVDTGPWIFGRKVLLPAGTVESVDTETRKLYVDRTRDEIKSAPEHDPSGYADQEYRLALADYYARFY
ncbi:MAG TPA: PRC-barrel domain-containing protein [Candidatus Polarisedimenticolia bacterium]|nr:PRC-barrel domain-containing protein [Candidatus Polarisedimenticolia bacterium]